MDEHDNRIDPDKWRPLILSFQEFCGLTPRLHPARLGATPEDLYRGADIAPARHQR